MMPVSEDMLVGAVWLALAKCDVEKYNLLVTLVRHFRDRGQDRIKNDRGRVIMSTNLGDAVELGLCLRILSLWSSARIHGGRIVEVYVLNDRGRQSLLDPRAPNVYLVEGV